MTRAMSKSVLTLLLALVLQGLLFANFAFAFQYGISLRGDGLEILLLVATAVVGILALLRVSWSRWPSWLQSLYVLNCINLVLLLWVAVLMGLGIYAVRPVATFKAPSGTQIILKNHAGLLGCTIDPYRIEGILERRIDHRENDTFCLNIATRDQIEAVRWSSDETQLILTLNRDGTIKDHTFELEPSD
ncbi:MAG: hypothetical protein HC812_01120 [Leptolyngbya sp. RL_3_1]|nr:hypothetical protein [Leptolyngbya sp. RL_3_1]